LDKSKNPFRDPSVQLTPEMIARLIEEGEELVKAFRSPRKKVQKMENCQTCRFYSQENGQCRRYPPTVLQGDLWSDDPTLRRYFEQERPSVAPSDWCGEYKERSNDSN